MPYLVSPYTTNHNSTLLSIFLSMNLLIFFNPLKIKY
jgi:hypothetical protein